MNDVVVDIGGTSINIISICHEKGVFDKIRYMEMLSPSSGNFYEDIAEIGNRVDTFNFGKVRNLVISFPGILIENKIYKWPNKSYWGEHPIEKFVKLFNPKEWQVIDDCTVGALSNLLLYPNRSNSLYINIGSGIGCGIIINGEIYLGDNGNSGELGHISVYPNSSLTCPCGNNGCLQLFASGKGILERAKMDDHSLSKYSTLQECLDNLIIKKKISEGATLLGQYISNLINILDITSLHINGGVTKIDEYNFTFLEVLKKQENNFLKRKVDINIRPFFNASLVGGIIKLLGEKNIDQVNFLINEMENKFKRW